MIDQVQFFRRGTVYRIRNCKTKRGMSYYSKLQLKTSEPEENADQLWVLNEVKNHHYEVIQIQSGAVLTYGQTKEGPAVVMEKDRTTKDQFWSIIFGQTLGDVNYFWIKPSENIELSLCASALNDSLKLSAIDQSLSICLWALEVYSPADSVLSRMSIFRSESSNLVLDISNLSSKEGVNIIQYLFTGSGNQRWTIDLYKEENEHSNEFTIRNYSSGLNLSSVFTKGSFKVIQSLFNCGSTSGGDCFTSRTGPTESSQLRTGCTSWAPQTTKEGARWPCCRTR